MRQGLILTATGGLLLLGILSARADGGGALVPIKTFLFGTGTVTISKGQSVTWNNSDQTPHNIVAIDKSFRSTPIDTGESYSRAFPEPGIYDYICGLHPQMKGRVVVSP